MWTRLVGSTLRVELFGTVGERRALFHSTNQCLQPPRRAELEWSWESRLEPSYGCLRDQVKVLLITLASSHLIGEAYGMQEVLKRV